ncbi:ferritin-like domain-containing protein [Cupriavidus sp. H18C2]|uniref:ferritin-like domain-containing protein n=1 Tax=Cupriavidus sp. H18C2 TaxID=3241602 RepID=UPI003BF7A232
MTFLLHMDAQIEHGLMVQYLYAAYTLGGPQVPEAMRDQVRTWREIILGIAKEEMGHLITVQNVLRLIGSPMCFEREDYPWSTPFYPFPFALEPLTLDSLAKYIFAEAPKDWHGPLADEIRARVKETVPNPRRVGDLFAELIDRISDADALPDSVFQPATTEYQADFSEWGRGYEAGKRGNASGANPPGTPNLIIKPLWSRAEAIAALKRIAEQGEAPATEADAAPSHFTRFVQVYKEMSKAPAGISYALPVATNPYVSWSEDVEPGSEYTGEETLSPITYPEAVLWAQLHNLRYRMLLALLEHSFHERGSAATSHGANRGMLINAAFGEMYNLRAISDLLMRLPLSADGGALSAAPPFQMPYTLQLPSFASDRWQAHLDVLNAAGALMKELESVTSENGKLFLRTSLNTDDQVKAIIAKVLHAHREAA